MSSPSSLRHSFLLLLTLSAGTAGLTAAACGGRSADFAGGGSGSSSGASSSGAGSGSGGSGGSSSGSSSGGSSGSSSGVSSSSSGASSSSSGGAEPCPVVLPPTGGACPDEGASCGYGDNNGCGQTCVCKGSQWACYPDPCIDPPPPPPVCPTSPPGPNSACNGDVGVCDYSDGSKCGGEQCTCDGNVWSCTTIACPPPQQCPVFPPAGGASCSDIGDSCVYYVNGECNEETCDCFTGVWSCSYSVGCIADAGVIVHP